MNDLVFFIIEELGSPRWMVAAYALMEELIARTVKLVDAVQRVLDGVRMHHVQKDGNAHGVCGVDQLL